MYLYLSLNERAVINAPIKTTYLCKVQKKTLMETINLEKLTTEALESIKGGGWIFQENQWIWIEDDPPTDDNDWIL